MTLSLLQQAAAISTLVLTVGVIWEYWEKLRHLPVLLLKFATFRSNAFERCVLKKLLVHSLPPILVVAGIGGELIFETADFIDENRKAAESDANLRTARKEAADGLNEASRKLDKAKSDIDAARAALRAQGPRWLLLEDKKKEFIDSMKVFAGQKFVSVRCGWPLPPEEFQTTGDIEFFLRSPENALWNVDVSGWDHCPVGGPTTNGGIGIFINSNATNKTKNAAWALFRALNEAGLNTVAPIPVAPTVPVNFFEAGSPERLAQTDSGEKIFLLVGPNPMYDLSGYAKWKARGGKR